MTQREEQREQAAKEIARKWYHDPNNETAYIAARQGMLWSDEHPSQELKEKFIDKAWEWIFRVFVITAPLDFQEAIEKEFRKEMTEE